MTLEWKDTTSYSQGERANGGKPRAWTVKLPVGDLTVLMHLHYPGWIWNLRGRGSFTSSTR